MIAKDNWRLVTAAGQDVDEGMTVLDFRGEAHTLQGGTPPHKSSSTGHVWTDQGEFFFDCVRTALEGRRLCRLNVLSAAR